MKSSAGNVADRSAPIATASKPPHLPAIGALRGLAALYVVLFHMTYVPAKRPAVAEWLLPFVTAGYTGVPLFFIISAFTLCHTMRARVEKRHTLRFYARRVIRIVPLFYVVLLATIARLLLSGRPIESNSTLLLNVLLLFNLVPGKEQGIVMASWSIGVEMLFYAAFPWLFHVVKGVRRAMVFFLASLAISAAFAMFVRHLSLTPEAQDDFFRFSLARSLPCFAIGMLVYRLYQAPTFVARVRRLPWAGGAAIALGAVAFVVLTQLELNNSKPAFALYSVAYAFLVMGILLTPFKIIVNRITEFYGEISYSVYLWHPLVIVYAVSAYPAFYTRFPPTLAWLGCLALTLAILTPLAFLSYKLIEQPTQQLGLHLLKRWQ